MVKLYGGKWGLQVGSRGEAVGLGKLEAVPWRQSIPCDVAVGGLTSWVGHSGGHGSDFQSSGPCLSACSASDFI